MTLSHVLLVLLVVVLGGGCTPVPEDSGEESEDVVDVPLEVTPEVLVIDDGFDAEDLEAIVLAVAAWVVACPDIAVQVSIGPTKDANVINGWPADFDTYPYGYAEYHKRVWLQADYIREDGADMRRLAMHELGHYFGVRGHVDNWNIMATGANVQSEELTAVDLAEMCEETGYCC